MIFIRTKNSILTSIPVDVREESPKNRNNFIIRQRITAHDFPCAKKSQLKNERNVVREVAVVRTYENQN